MAATKKITNRAFSVLLIAALVICGMAVYVMRYVDHGKEWALYFSRANSGSTGQIVDRNGITLAYFNGTDNYFSPERVTRAANYHVTGDYWGRTGTGILTRFWGDNQTFSLLTGTTRSEDQLLELNIDARLNRQIYLALGENSTGCMLVCNYRTGELLGMVSTPSVDPIDGSNNPREGAYINRCISASFTPGSIFKLITAAAAIENLRNLDSRSWYCEDGIKIAGVEITCIADHYTQNFEQALANSCNVAFSQIAVELGQPRLIQYVTDYGFLDSHSLDGIPTAKGSYPLEFVGDPETGWSGIGQSTDMVCPFSMLRFLCAVANDGTLLEPHMINDGTPEISDLVKPATAERLKELMRNNAVTHYNADTLFPGMAICAKTGTAELGDGDSHSWFVGFLDDEEHPYAFVTLVERGGFGLTKAGAVTSEVLKWAVENLDT